MLAQLETLVALAEAGSMTRAATRLRLTQSAISKRIDALETEVGAALIERNRRGVCLTARAEELVERTRPLLAELKRSLSGSSSVGKMVMGVSESLLASWAPEALSAVVRELPGLDLKLNAHRSPVAVDLVRAGEYALALVAGHAEIAPDLCAERLGVEPMVLLASRGQRPKLRRGTALRVLTIEPQSATWRSLKEGLQSLKRERGLEFEVLHTLQSFSAIVQMARAGFGHALVPLGIARAMGVTTSNIVELPSPGLSRPISLFGRKTAFQRPEVSALTRALQAKVDVSLLAKQLRSRG